MAEQRIDSIYDLQAIEAQQKATQALVQKTVDDIKKAKELSIDFNVNTKTIADFNKKIKELELQLARVQKSSDAATKSAILSSKAQEADAKARTANAKAAQAEEKATVQSAKAKQIEEATVKNLLKEKEKLAKQQERESKLLDQAENDYLQLSKAYNDAALKAKNYALSLGETHPATIAAISDAKAMGDTLKRLDATVGQHQRNVGNYTQATFALTQVLREAPAFANSFATGISAIGNNVPILVDQFKILRTEVGSGFKALKILGGSLLSFQALLPIGFLLLQSFGKELGNFIGSLFGTVQAAEESAAAMKKYNDSIDIGRARVNALAESIQFLNTIGRINLEIDFGEGFELKDLQAQSVGVATQISQITDQLRDLQKQSDNAFNQFTEGVLLEKDYNATLESIAKRRTELQTTEAKLSKEQSIIYRQIALQRKKDDEAENDRRKKANDNSKELLERDRKARFEILKANLELNKEYDLLRSNDEKKSFADRTVNLINYGIDSTMLIKAQAKFELSEAGLTANERLRIENEKNNALIRLNTELNDRLKKLALEQADAFAVGDDRPETSSKLPAGIQKALDDFKKAQKAAIEQAKDDAEELGKAMTDALLSLSTELQGLFFDVFQNNIERQKNAVQDQIDLLEQQKQKEIELANQTIASAAERADAIAIINARAEAKKQQLELRQRQLDQQKAKFEKANAVTRIIQETAVAVISSFKTDPTGILAAIIAAIGAAQLVRVLAQPIPRYAEGTDNHPGGKAVVGDGGKSEAVVMPDGSIYRTPATSTVVDLPAGTKVYPDYDKMMLNATMTKTPIFNVKSSDNSNELRQGFKSVVRAVKSIPQPVLKTDGAWSRAMRTGSNFRTYLNNNL